MKMKTGCSLVGILLLVVIQLAASFPSQTAEVGEVPPQTTKVEETVVSKGVGHENAKITSVTTGAAKQTETSQSNPTNEDQATGQSNPPTLTNKPHNILTSISSGSSSGMSAYNRPFGSLASSGFMAPPFGSSHLTNHLFKHRASIFSNSPSNKMSTVPSESANLGNNGNGQGYTNMLTSM